MTTEQAWQQSNDNQSFMDVLALHSIDSETALALTSQFTDKNLIAESVTLVFSMKETTLGNDELMELLREESQEELAEREDQVHRGLFDDEDIDSLVDDTDWIATEDDALAFDHVYRTLSELRDSAFDMARVQEVFEEIGLGVPSQKFQRCYDMFQIGIVLLSGIFGSEE